MKLIVVAALAVTVVLSAVLLPGCGNGPGPRPDTFTSTYYVGEEGRSISISGSSRSAPGSQSEYLLKVRSGEQAWQDEYWVLLIDSDSVLQAVVHERFALPGSTGMQRPVAIRFPARFAGALGLCVIIPARATMISTLLIGVDEAPGTGWADAETLQAYLRAHSG